MKFHDLRIIFFMAWLAAGLVVFYLWAIKRRNADMKSFADTGLIKKITVFYDQRIYSARIICNVMAVILIMVALARPQWGFDWKENNPKGVDILIALDASKSMLATDVLPNRLEFTKLEIADFVKRLKNDRVGLIAFAGASFLQCPLTVHYNGFLLTLNDLDTDIIAKGGTSIASAIDEALKGYRGAKTNDKMLIIITDGENTEGDLKEALGRAKKEKVRISCIGIGTKEGSLIPVAEDQEKRLYVKDDSGRAVKSRLDEATLQAMAASTGGVYIHATQEDFGLGKIYEKYLLTTEKLEFKGNMVKVYKERFQFPLAFAACFLLAGLILGGKSEEKKT